MKSSRLALGIGFICLMAWGLPACSDDDDGGGTSGTGGTGGSTGGTGGATGGTAGTGTGGSAGTGTGGSAGTGTGGSAGGLTCTMAGNPNPASKDNCVGQETEVAAMYGGKTISEITRACATGECIGTPAGPDNVTCVNTCIQKTVAGAVTTECTACFAGTASCSKANCLAQCIGGASAECDGCQCGCDCIAEYEACSGLTSSVTCQ